MKLRAKRGKWNGGLAPYGWRIEDGRLKVMREEAVVLHQMRKVLRHSDIIVASAKQGARIMERIVKIHIEKLPEGLYLATSEDVQGLVAQGRTVTETLEIARDVVRKLLEAQRQRHAAPSLPDLAESFDYPLVVSD